MSQLTRLFVNDENLAALPVDIRKRVPYLLATTLLLIVFFAVSVALKFQENPETFRLFSLAVIITSCGFFVSLVLMRMRCFLAASNVTIACLFLDLQWMGFLLPVTHYLEVYRYLTYSFASIIVVTLVAMRIQTLLAYGILCIIGEITLSTTLIAGHEGGMTKELIVVTILGVIVQSTITFVSFLISRFTSVLVNLAREEEEKSQSRFFQLRSLVDDTKKSFNIGEVILKTADFNLQQAKDISESAMKIQNLIKEIDQISRSSAEDSQEILAHTRLMRDGVNNSNQAIDSSSAGVSQIIATISQIAESANAKQGEIHGLLGIVEGQRNEIEQIRHSLQGMVESSRQFETIIATISDISEQTSLLAMNASIEAAHAGDSGRGFGVIATQVKKLSESARNSTGQVAGILANNTESMEKGAHLIENTARYFANLTEQMRKTVDSIEETLRGMSEISKGTGEIQTASSQLIVLSRKTSDMVESIEKMALQLGEQATLVAQASQESVTAVSGMLGHVLEIDSSLKSMAIAGKDNIKGLNQLENGLKAITKK